MSNNSITFYASLAGEKLQTLRELPAKYKSLDDNQKHTLAVITVTSCLFITIGVLFGFIPFMCAGLGYFTPHIAQKITDSDELEENKIYYAIGAALFYVLFNLGASIGYGIGAFLYTIEPIHIQELRQLTIKKEPEYIAFWRAALQSESPGITQDGNPVSRKTKTENTLKLGRVNSKDIDALWKKSTDAIGIQYNYKRRQADYRVDAFLKLLSAKKRKEFIDDYGWPEEIPNRGISLSGAYQSVLGLAQYLKPKAKD